MAEIKTWRDPELRRLVKKTGGGRQAAVIPVGSTEQHGPHLPVSTDSDIVSEVSRRLARRAGFWLLPTVEYGVSFEHAPFFQLSVRGATLRATLRDLCGSLSDNGIGTVFIINGHHGNLGALKGVGGNGRAGAAAGGRPRVHVFSYWHFMRGEFDHAGLAETSLMLAISKNVKMGLAQKGLVTEGMGKKEAGRLGRLASRSFPEATKNGVWGDPRGATKRLGQAMLSEIVENLQKRCQTCLTGNGP